MPRAVAWSWCPRLCEIRIVAPAARNGVYAACNHGLDAAACNNVSRGNWKICKAPSNRAKCTKCEAKIEAGELRIELLHYWSLPGARVGTNGRYHLTNYGQTVMNSNGAAAKHRKCFEDVQRQTHSGRYGVYAESAYTFCTGRVVAQRPSLQRKQALALREMARMLSDAHQNSKTRRWAKLSMPCRC